MEGCYPSTRHKAYRLVNGAMKVVVRGLCGCNAYLHVEYNVNALQDQSAQILPANHNYANFVRKLTAR